MTNTELLDFMEGLGQRLPTHYWFSVDLDPAGEDTTFRMYRNNVKSILTIPRKSLTKTLLLNYVLPQMKYEIDIQRATGISRYT